MSNGEIVEKLTQEDDDSRPFVSGILGAFESTWLVNLALGCTWEHSVALGKPSRTYLRTYLKFTTVELFTAF